MSVVGLGVSASRAIGPIVISGVSHVVGVPAPSLPGVPCQGALSLPCEIPKDLKNALFLNIPGIPEPTDLHCRYRGIPRRCACSVVTGGSRDDGVALLGIPATRELHCLDRGFPR